MSKNEYLNLLGNNLRSLTMEEYSNVMQYYSEYFEDAGPENEQKVIDELGSPEELAARIVAESVDRSMSPRWQDNSNQNSNQNNDQSNNQYNGQNNNQNNGQNYQNNNQNYNQNGNPHPYDYRDDRPQKRRMSPVVIALIIILGFPLWIGLAGAAFGIIVGILAVVFAFGVCAVALVAATIVTIVASIGTFFSSPATGVVGLGAAFILLAIALGFIMLTVLLAKIIASVCRAIFGRRRA